MFSLYIFLLFSFSYSLFFLYCIIYHVCSIYICCYISLFLPIFSLCFSCKLSFAILFCFLRRPVHLLYFFIGIFLIFSQFDFLRASCFFFLATQIHRPCSYLSLLSFFPSLIIVPFIPFFASFLPISCLMFSSLLTTHNAFSASG